MRDREDPAGLARNCRKWLSDFTYKPSWKFQVLPIMPFNHVTIKMNAWLPDTNQVRDFSNLPSPVVETRYPYMPHWDEDRGIPIQIPHVEITGVVNVPFYVETREEFFYWFLREGIPSLEGHEMLEWARVNGQPVFDPHPAYEGSISKPSIKHYTLGPEKESDDGEAQVKEWLSMGSNLTWSIPSDARGYRFRDPARFYRP